MTDKEYVLGVWDYARPQSFRQAKKVVAEAELSCSEGTLRAYFSAWKKSHGIQRRYRKSGERADE